MKLCNSCGEDLGDELIYCKSCLIKMQEERRIIRESTRAVNLFIPKTGQQGVSVFNRRSAIFIIPTLLVSCLSVLTFLISKFNFSPSFFEAFILASAITGCVSYITLWIMMFTKVLVMEPLWALFSLLLPWLLYLYVFRISFENYKKHLFGIAASIVLFTSCLTFYTHLRVSQPAIGLTFSLQMVVAPVSCIRNFEDIISAIDSTKILRRY